MRSWLILGALAFVVSGGLGLSACADGVFLEGGAPEDQVDMGAPDLGQPDLGSPDTGSPDMGEPDSGPPDMGPPDMGPPDMGPDLGPCNGQPTCCGDGIVQASEECEPGLPIGNPDRCPVNPGTDCNQMSGVMCIEGNNCLRRCVPQNLLNPAQICP
ncbi:MAG: hypothetical protein R3B40_05460 [Polyangiales bacterium]|nr:hypothetical protein [Sandaracinaceae bacterium]